MFTALYEFIFGKSERSLKTLIVAPIFDVDPKTKTLATNSDEENPSEDSCRASAILSLPNGQQIQVSKEGGTFIVEPPIKLSDEMKDQVAFHSELYIYDRQPETGYSFKVHSTATPDRNGVARVKFYQGYPAICFYLVDQP